MKSPKTILCYSLVGGYLFAAVANGQTIIENFEYADNPALLAEWMPGGATLTLSSYVAADATGTNSLRVDRNFAAATWDTEVLTKTPLAAPVAIATNQYITIRIAGDPQFTNATFRSLYVYAYDSAGNFGRWGSTIPTTPNWQVFNFTANSIAAPWDSPGLPNLSDIVRFKIYIYGQGDPPGAAYSATLYLDDLMIRDTPLLPPPPPTGQTMIQDFEYASNAAMVADWKAQLGTLALSRYVSPNSKGTNSLRIDRTFAASAWDTEVVTGPVLSAPVAIRPSQWITFRLAGDPQFTNSSWQMLYIYAFDGTGNFGRWGTAVPTSTNWQVINVLANTIQAPWNSPGLPNLNNLTQFSIYIYGQGDPAGSSFPSTIYIDELMIRDTALAELPPPSAVRPLIDDFEGYADDPALLNFYGYVNSPAATATTASLLSPAPQGSKALKLAIDFAPGRYPWGSVRSPVVEPFSLPTNAVVQCRFKGDPSLASVADADTTFWLSFYDQGQNAFNFAAPASVVTSADWTIVKARYNQFWATTAVDTGNLVRWRILVQGWNGTTETPALSGTFYVDDIKITIPPMLSITRQAGVLKLQMSGLIPGTTYTIQQSPDCSTWLPAASIQATAATASWTIPAGQKGFYQVSYTP